SDPPFRAVCKANGADLMYTEFISSEGLIRAAAKSRQKLDVFDYERPIGIQLFGSDVHTMGECAAISTEAGPDLIDINYGCPVKQLYKGEADWRLIAKIKENPRIKIPIFGNGDIDSPEKALEYKTRYGVDGVMIGRAAIGYPWIFRE
nr:hypothetical protein [Tanacetum cinerariifolium]